MFEREARPFLDPESFLSQALFFYFHISLPTNAASQFFPRWEGLAGLLGPLPASLQQIHLASAGAPN